MAKKRSARQRNHPKGEQLSLAPGGSARRKRGQLPRVAGAVALSPLVVWAGQSIADHSSPAYGSVNPSGTTTNTANSPLPVSEITPPTSVLQQQQRLRAMFGFPSDQATVQQILSQPDASQTMAALGIAVTAAEAQQLAQRLKVQLALENNMATVTQLAGANYAGTYLDLPNGGVVHVLLAGSSTLTNADIEALLPAGASVSIDSATNSLAVLQATQRQVLDDAPTLADLGIHLSSVGIDFETNRVTIGAPGLTGSQRELLDSRYGPTLISASNTPPIQTASDRTNFYPPMVGGTYLTDDYDGRQCTSSIGVFTSGNYPVQITAGHCDLRGNGDYFSQGAYQIGYMKDNQEHSGTTADVGFINNPDNFTQWVYSSPTTHFTPPSAIGQAVQGAAVLISKGAGTGPTGIVADGTVTNSDITIMENGTLKVQAQEEVSGPCPLMGDSGSPYLDLGTKSYYGDLVDTEVGSCVSYFTPWANIVFLTGAQF